MAHPRLLRLFQEHESDLVAFMTVRLRCRFTAHDLAQELFLKLTALESGLEVSNARAYLFRMAANLVTDHQRREQRQLGLLMEIQGHLWGSSDSLSPERRVMAQQELRDLAKAVEVMTPATRRIFKLNRFDGKTQKEIARELGISQTAVEKHIRKALAKLAAHRHED